MQFKKLQLTGFKTFADKTEIDLGEGMTAVVGPNGSGKSNIADAILWVMGEQNPRLLRGSESRDVIFAGSDRRKPLGMAEVRLTIDNSDKSLPIDFAEVTVTRRIYRSGESHYLLNNAACRLKDIVELFLDTGMGRGAYAMVSQTEIDAVLSARPEDRRELFEEAAGIKKYRVKKREAVRKLEQAESNLERVRDIVYELLQQREPLRQQAEEAKRYLELTERLQEIEVGLLISEIKTLDYELYAAREEQNLNRDAIGKFDSDLARMEREAELIGEKLAGAEQESDVARISHQGALTTVERTESRLQLIRERGDTAEQNADLLDQEIRGLNARSAAANSEILAHNSEAGKWRAESAAIATRIEESRKRLQSLDLELSETLRESEDRHGAMLRAAERRAHREAALDSARRRLEEITSKKALNISAIESTSEDLQAARDRSAQLSAELETSEAAAAGEDATLSALQDQKREGIGEHTKVRADLESARRDLATRESRLSTLVELQEAGEGLFQGVREVLKANRAGKLAGFYAPVVDLITVPEEYRIAIEVALGSSIQDLVCETETEAKSAIEWLKTNRAGRATFLALPLLRPSKPIDPKEAGIHEGILGCAADIVQAHSRFGPVLSLLLGRVLIARSMNDAITAARNAQGWSRIVTLSGEVLTPGGALTGGSIHSRAANLVSRKGEIDDLTSALPALRMKVATAEAALDSVASQLSNVEVRLAESTRNLASSRSALAVARGEQAGIERDITRISTSLQELETESTQLAESGARTGEQIQHLAAEINADSAEDSEDASMTRAQERARNLSHQRDEARVVLAALEVEAGRIIEKCAASDRDLVSARRALADTTETIRSKQTQRETAGARFAEADSVRESLSRELEIARARATECEAHVAKCQERCRLLRSQSFEQVTVVKETTLARSAALQQQHDAELQIARLEVRLAQSAQRLDEEYGIPMDEALARPEVDEIDRKTSAEVARLRREARSMGQVNTGAVDEYERLTERHDFLSTQQDDLQTARDSLMHTIREIDESTRGIFMETFEAVSREFSSLFTRLFRGGTTRLLLTDPDDLLETGIEVIAQPPGKKAQHLSLLSGGERALTAVALLFSFLAVRPSPFCLLDEVDAPLDGSNVEKFAELVRDFSLKTQFLLITHNPTTMEASPHWYGVTMQEPGVSRILSYRVPTHAVVSEPEPLLVLEPSVVTVAG